MKNKLIFKKQLISMIIFLFIAIFCIVPYLFIKGGAVEHCVSWSSVPENAINIKSETIEITDKLYNERTSVRYLCGLTEDGEYVEYKADNKTYGTTQIGDTLIRYRYDIPLTYITRLNNRLDILIIGCVIIFIGTIIFFLIF